MTSIPSNFPFTLPIGGDTEVLSMDGTHFSVHSEVLARNSTVFSDMFSFGIEAEEGITLTDDAESISLMLAFVYPPSRLCGPDITLFDKSLKMAQKYDIENMTVSLDQSIQNGIHARFLRTNPFQVLELSLTYELRVTYLLAIKNLQAQYGRFHTLKAIRNFTARFPSTASLMHLAGTTGTRAKILHDILYDFNSGLPEEPDHNVFSNLMCTQCYKDFWRLNYFSDLSHRPHWLFDWARLAFNELIAKDLDECAYLFDASVFRQLGPGSDYPQCIMELEGHELIFNEWATNVRSMLDNKFSELESLCPF